MRVERARAGTESRQPGKSQEPGQVQSLRRALSLLEHVAAAGEGLTVTEAARAAGLPISTAHRLLTTLESARYVRFEPGANLWQIGVQAFATGNAFTRTRDIVAIARPHLRRLMEETRETANLYIHDDGRAVCMAQVESRQMMRAIARPGGRTALHCSGAGKAILAYLDARSVERILTDHGQPPITHATLTDRAALEADLAAVRRRGWALDDEEHEIGLRCVAACVLDEHAEPAAALSISGPLARIDDARMAAMGALLAKAAAELSALYGKR